METMSTNSRVSRFIKHLHRNNLSLQYSQEASSNPESVRATIAIVTSEGRAVGVDDEELQNLFFPVLIECEGKDLQAASLPNMTLHLMEWLKSENYSVVLAKSPVPLWPKPLPRRRKSALRRL